MPPGTFTSNTSEIFPKSTTEIEIIGNKRKFQLSRGDKNIYPLIDPIENGSQAIEINNLIRSCATYAPPGPPTALASHSDVPLVFSAPVSPSSRMQSNASSTSS